MSKHHRCCCHAAASAADAVIASGFEHFLRILRRQRYRQLRRQRSSAQRISFVSSSSTLLERIFRSEYEPNRSATPLARARPAIVRLCVPRRSISPSVDAVFVVIIVPIVIAGIQKKTWKHKLFHEQPVRSDKSRVESSRSSVLCRRRSGFSQSACVPVRWPKQGYYRGTT